ncbi:MAG: NAD-binding protein [Methylovulum sp.]|jgi:voltage-gated potassium channel|nr:NAD-binding protein [Methylovulum sp.]MCF7998634.1 NAD-binding protein [Methylovulum sp.]MCF8006346.1 NAD-binding protein [Methylovulum sp.]
MKNIAIFGYSIMSLEVMKRLQQSQHRLIFIGRNESEAVLVAEQGFASQAIDFRNDEELKAIGIGSLIDVLFCFFTTDSDNVFLTISARALDKELVIIAIVDDPESAEKLLAAGANKIIDPYEICGRKTHEMLTRPHISNIMDNTVFRRHDLNLAQIEIPKGSCLENTQLNDLNLSEKHNLILIGVVDLEFGDDLHFAIGETNHRLDAGDVLVVLGVASEIQTFKKAISPH